jgi:hypothetical protein
MNVTDLAIMWWSRARLAALHDETVIHPGVSNGAHVVAGNADPDGALAGNPTISFW